jgi:hypothetical protein
MRNWCVFDWRFVGVVLCLLASVPKTSWATTRTVNMDFCDGVKYADRIFVQKQVRSAAGLQAVVTEVLYRGPKSEPLKAGDFGSDDSREGWLDHGSYLKFEVTFDLQRIQKNDAGLHQIGPFRVDKHKRLVEAVRRAVQGEPVIAGFVSDLKGAAIRGFGIKLTSAKHTWSGVTDDQGFYMALNLPPGRYKLTVDKSGVTAANTFGELRYPVKQPFDLNDLNVGPRSCLMPNIAVFAGSSISGRIIDSSGAPVPKQAVRLDPDKEYEFRLYGLLNTTTDAGGNFTFPALPIGTYDAWAMTFATDDAWRSGNFISKFASAKSSQRISVLAGKPITNVEIKIKPSTAVAVTMVAVNGRGRRLKGISAQLYRYLPNSADLGFPRGETNVRGELTVLLGEGESYSLTAIHPDDGKKGDRRSDPVPFVAKRGQRIVITVP